MLAAWSDGCRCDQLGEETRTPANYYYTLVNVRLNFFAMVFLLTNCCPAFALKLAGVRHNGA